MLKSHIRPLCLVLTTALMPSFVIAQTSDWLGDQARLGRFHGVAVVSDADGARKVFAHGFADTNRTRANGDEVAYPLGSLAKPLTALAVMQLVEEGAATLDDPIAQHLPALVGKPASSVTLRQLLSHSGGVPSVMRSGQGLDMDPFIAAIDQPMQRDALLAEFVDAPLLFPPGSRYGYSNSGYVLLALMLEAIDERPWMETLQARVLGPAGVSTACLCAAMPGRFNAVPMEGLDGAVTPASTIHPDRAFGAGALIATPAAMLDLVAAVRAGQVVDKDTLELMWAPVVSTGNDGHAYGLGWEIVERGGRRLVGHAGGVPGAVSHLRFDPGSAAAAIVVINRTLPLESLGRHQAHVIEMGDALVVEQLGMSASWTAPRLAAAMQTPDWVGEWRIDEVHSFRLSAGAEGSLQLDPLGNWSVFNLRQRQRLSTPEALATAQRVQAWAGGDGGPLYAAMAPELAAEMDPARLEAMFKGVSAEFGAHRESWVFSTANDVHRVRFLFDEGAIDVALLHDAEGRIGGLRLDGSEREEPPRQARVWPLADGGVLLDRFSQGHGDQVWPQDGNGAIVIDTEAPLRAVREDGGAIAR